MRTELSAEQDGRGYPNLSGVATQDDVSRKAGKKFQAEYINWSKTMEEMRTHAPGWLPMAIPSGETSIVHLAPNGSGYLMICFVDKETGERTPGVVHAIMDDRNEAKKVIDSRDVSDAFVRGVCKAAALQFGFAWQMWSKDDPMGRPSPAPVTVTVAVADADASSAGSVGDEAVQVDLTPGDGDANSYVSKALLFIGQSTTGVGLAGATRRLTELWAERKVDAKEGKLIRNAIATRINELNLVDTPRVHIRSLMPDFE